MSLLTFSRPCSYAVRALTYLALQPVGKLSGAREIAESQGIPHAFLGKVLLPLCREHVLRSRKGISGGYELALPPQQINLLAIVRVIEGEPWKDCLLEDHECSKPRQCLLHSCWSPVRAMLLAYLERTTLADLVKLYQAGGGARADSGIKPAPKPAGTVQIKGQGE
jgi:Rrf2 family iron-sulfur cluster assembly transcriptional regulator